MQRLAIFASGTGSNALKIIEYFDENPDVEIALVVSNKPQAGVLSIANKHNIPTIILDRYAFYETENLLRELSEVKIDFIVLAGFLWLIPNYLVRQYDQRIVNIHPALLPKFGGKGMYGMHVHRAVKEAKETASGITIHYVNEKYDEGDIIFQARCSLSMDDTPEQISKKVLQLEHLHYARVLEKLLKE